MKITKLEAGVYIIEKGQLVLKLSKLKSEWVLIYQDQIVGKCESKERDSLTFERTLNLLKKLLQNLKNKKEGGFK